MNKRQNLWHITFQDYIYGYVSLGESFEITSDEQWRELLPLHHWDVPERPYHRTVAHKVAQAVAFDVPIRFWKKRCAIGTTIFRAWELGLEPESQNQGVHGQNQSQSQSHDTAASDSNDDDPDPDPDHDLHDSARNSGHCDVVKDSRFSGVLSLSARSVQFKLPVCLFLISV